MTLFIIKILYDNYQRSKKIEKQTQKLILLYTVIPDISHLSNIKYLRYLYKWLYYSGNKQRHMIKSLFLCHAFNFWEMTNVFCFHYVWLSSSFTQYPIQFIDLHLRKIVTKNYVTLRIYLFNYNAARLFPCFPLDSTKVQLCIMFIHTAFSSI